MHGVFGPIPAALAFLIGWHASYKRTRTTARLVGAALLAATVWILVSTPAWYKSQARFNLVFSKITKGSPSPDRDLAELGLSAADARYIGLNSYVAGGPMENQVWVEQFGKRCTYGRVLRFYLRHPSRGLAILRADLQEQAWQRRVPGLSNFAPNSGRPEGAMAVSLGSWSALSTWVSRKWPVLNVVWLMLLPPAAFLLAFDAPFRRALAWTILALSVIATGELALASLADAIETPRHLLIFHLYSDASLFLGVAFAANLLEAACPVAFRKPASAMVSAALAIFAVAIAKFEVRADAAPVAALTGYAAIPAEAVDDTSLAVIYAGNWAAGAFGSAFHGTMTYSYEPGATARFSFEGAELQYVYTKAPNRGIALVTIDGSSTQTIDLYDPQIVWQARTRFGGLKTGRHQVEIRVLGRHNPDSSGNFIDIDALVGR